MLVSIIVPVYNVEQYLAQCLDSILAQTYRDLEVIVVNDGSSDRSLSICKHYAAKDQRVRLVDKPNGGLSDARNCGIEHATGEYLAFIDGDDYISTDFVASLLKPFNAPQLMVSVCAFYLTTETGTDYEWCHVLPANQVSGRELIKRMLIRGDGWHYVIACNKLYRREVFARVRYDVGRHYEDDFISAPLFYGLDAIAVIDKPLYHYVQRDGSIMKSTLTDRKAADYLDLCLEKINFLGKKKDPELVDATKRKLFDWVFDEPTRRGQALSPQMKRRIQQTYRELYSLHLYRGDVRYQVLGMLGYVDLRLVSGLRALLNPIKRVTSAIRH